MKLTKIWQHAAYTWRNSVSSSLRETSENPFFFWGGEGWRKVNHSMCVSIHDFSIWQRPMQSTALSQSPPLCQGDGTNLLLRIVLDTLLGWLQCRVVHLYRPPVLCRHWEKSNFNCHPWTWGPRRQRCWGAAGGGHAQSSQCSLCFLSQRPGERSPPGSRKCKGGAWHRFLLQTPSLLQCSVQFTYECCGVLHMQELREQKGTGSEGQGKGKKTWQ